jgi:hypothetical protein
MLTEPELGVCRPYAMSLAAIERAFAASQTAVLPFLLRWELNFHYWTAGFTYNRPIYMANRTPKRWSCGKHSMNTIAGEGRRKW